MTIIYHNPNCGTSRNVLAMIRASGEEPHVIEYLKTPPSRAKLVQLIADMKIPVRDLLRRKGTPYDELGLDDPSVSDDQLIDFMLEHPILINRPIVVSAKGTALCRPSEKVLNLLSAPVASFAKEDGETVYRSPVVLDEATPNLIEESFHQMDREALLNPPLSDHPPRVLMIYGSLRERSFSRLLTEEAARILRHLGAEVKIFDPAGLPLVGSVNESHPKVQQLRTLSIWSEAQVWCSPERHGNMTGLMKSIIDWLPLSAGAIRPTQGRTLALVQVCGGSQSFNTVNQMRTLGRWMRMVTIPNQSSVPRAFTEFDDAGRMKPSSYYNRMVDVMEELMKFTLLIRDRSDYLVDRYSERVETAEELSKRVNQRSI